jgi:two-component system response regulator
LYSDTSVFGEQLPAFSYHFGSGVAANRSRDGTVDKRTILIVEDNPSDEALLTRALKKAGITNPVISVKDGLEALQYLFGSGRYEYRDVGDLPAIVLIDLNLPRLDGLEVLRRMRADYRTKLIPVTIFTSSVDEQDLINGYSLGANSYVRKPTDFAKFSRIVEALVTYWIALNEPPPPGEKIWAHHFRPEKKRARPIRLPADGRVLSCVPPFARQRR